MGHKEWGSLHYGNFRTRFVNLLGGGSNKYGDGWSWSGWIYGPTFTWGYPWMKGLGDHDNLLEDVLVNSKLAVFWSTDPTIVETLYRTHDPCWNRIWMKEMGIKMIFINPIYTDTNAVWGDQWIPIYPGADTALALAIANVWIKEGTYDKQYVDTHTVGFEKFSDYVLGKTPGTDGAIDRTPEWASSITGVDAQTIVNLAREWASKPTTLVCTNAGVCRISYGTEWARMMVTLQAMQGIGKPGVSIWSCGCGGTVSIGAPWDPRQVAPPGYSVNIQFVQKINPKNPIVQGVHYLNMPQAILTDFTNNPPIKWKGGIGTGTATFPDNDVYREFTYPMPGNSEIHMLWHYGGSTFSIEAQGALYAKAYQSPKIEFAVAQTDIMEVELQYCDLILPVASSFERNDLSEVGQTGRAANGLNNRIVVYQHKCIEPLYESKLDYDVFVELADRLGFADKFTEGNTEDTWLEKMYKTSTVPLTWEEFKAKGYYVFELPKDYRRVVTPNQKDEDSIGVRWFNNKATGLATPSGKIEIWSQRLADRYGELNNAIGTVPQYFVPDEGRNTPIAATYPLHVVTPHPKYRVHQQMDNISWLADLYKYNGYEPAWIHATDAEPRGIKEKDIIRIFNDRGQTLCYAHVTERVMPGVIKVDEGSWYKPAEPGNTDSIDTGGDINVLTSLQPMSPHAYTCRYNSCMVQVEKWKG
jgi:molybdopterin guanine dinucleotide-containing S/N-oxide reductase-like protein